MTMRVLFATAEIAPLARVGGLAEAASGLVAEFRRNFADDVSVDVVMPDYGDVELDDETTTSLSVPDWAGGRASIRRGRHADLGEVALVATKGTKRPHPYVDSAGEGWPDNDVRFYGFAAAVGAIAAATEPNLVHLNDWHAAGSVGFLPPDIPTVLTIHTLGYQGVASHEWIGRVEHHFADFRWYDSSSPLAAAIRRCDRIIAVSPNYAREILTADMGAGLHDELAARGDALVGIRNGIDTAEWNPTIDRHIASNYRVGDAARRKLDNQRALFERVGWSFPADPAQVIEPVVGVVSRLVEQKGIDLLIETLPFVEHLGARVVVLGSGDAATAAALQHAADAQPDRVAFVNGYDLELAHMIFAGADLFAMPSRFEPCGLAQMQAMAYGALPIVTAVGGLVDTVTDADDHPDVGTGFVAASATGAAFTDALHRAVKRWHSKSARAGARRNGMTTDWSWTAPARQHLEIYRSVIAH